MQFVDRVLARRLEAGEDEAQLAVAAVLQQHRPALGVDSMSIAGGHAVFAGLNSPVGRVIGAGLKEPMTAIDVDAVEEFYRAHGAAAQFDVTPLTDESLTAILLKRGYSMSELNNVMARRLSPHDRFADQTPGIEFRICLPEQASLWTTTMLRGFFAPQLPPAGWDDLLFPMAVTPNSLAMLAWEGDQAVAAAAGLICPEWKLVMLGGTSTLPSHRARGIQTAAIGRRLNLAIAQGCDLAVVVTRGGTTSQRNAERMGFTLAYSKATLLQKRQVI